MTDHKKRSFTVDGRLLAGGGLAVSDSTPAARRLAEAVHDAINAHSEDLAAKRKDESARLFGHPGAYISDLYPTRESEIEAIERVLRDVV